MPAEPWHACPLSQTSNRSLVSEFPSKPSEGQRFSLLKSQREAKRRLGEILVHTFDDLKADRTIGFRLIVVLYSSLTALEILRCVPNGFQFRSSETALRGTLFLNETLRKPMIHILDASEADGTGKSSSKVRSK